jgi:tRNA threonylcarbamoyladenosine biosynthesis protein TsaB
VNPQQNGVLLAIDTATANGGVAVGRAGALLAEVGIGDTGRHSELLLPAIEFALRVAGVNRADLTAIVLGAGPGSFTGVRIAAATARGLAAALGIPILAYSSLAALAAAAGRGDDPVCALFDARRGEVYGACYRFPAAGGMDTLLAPRAAPVEDLVHAIGDLDVEFVGDGAAQYAGRLPRQPVPTSLVYPRASALLWLAGYDASAGAASASHDFEPDYIRSAGAERERAQAVARSQQQGARA